MDFRGAHPPNFTDTLPTETDVVVIGAGVIGISTALFLARAGARVAVLEKGRVAGEQSSRNWGWIRQQGRDPDELPIVTESIRHWEALAPTLDTDIGFSRQGVLYTARSESEMAHHEAWMETAERHQLDTRLLTAAELSELIPDLKGPYVGGMLTPSDARAEPFRAVPALARAAQRDGAVICERCAVRSVETTGGRISGVITERGTVRTSAAVLAGGAWSSLFLANLGIRLPQLTVRATVLRTASAPNVMAANAALGEIAVRRRQDGGYSIAAAAANEHYVGADSFRYFMPFMPALWQSFRFLRLRFGGDLIRRLTPTRQWAEDAVTPFERVRVLNPDPSERAVAQMRRGLAKRLPALAELPFEQAWAGMIDVTPDVVPVMDEIETQPGMWLATGFSGHGFGIGPGAGRVMADLVLGKPPGYDLTRFRFSRFSDGSPMVPGPGL